MQFNANSYDDEMAKLKQQEKEEEEPQAGVVVVGPAGAVPGRLLFINANIDPNDREMQALLEQPMARW